MSIYSLKEGYYLYHDVEFVLNQISELYEIDVKDNKATAASIMELDQKNHFASPESKDRFNAIPVCIIYWRAFTGLPIIKYSIPLLSKSDSLILNISGC
jgi:hypothetical protein